MTFIISLVVFGILAHQQVGQLVQMGNAAGTYTAIGCWATAGLIVLGAALLKIRDFCHKNRRGAAHAFEAFIPVPTNRDRPTKVKDPIVDYLLFNIGSPPSSEEEKKGEEGRYSYNGLSATEKLHRQTACAIAEGKKNTKVIDQAKFTVTVNPQDFTEFSTDCEVIQDKGKRATLENLYSSQFIDIQRGNDTIQVDLNGVYDAYDGIEAAASVRDHIVEKLKEKLEAAADLEHETVCDLLTLTMIELEREFLAKYGAQTYSSTCITCSMTIKKLTNMVKAASLKLVIFN